MANYVVDAVEALLNDDFVTVPKVLAAAIGLDEAVIVKQIWAWCKHNQKRKDKQHFKQGHYWTYNSYEEWVSEFPWMKKRTIQRKILKLEKMGILVSDRHRAVQNDQTKWYRVAPEILFTFYKAVKSGAVEDDKVAPSTTCQIDAVDSAKMARSRECQNGTMSYKKNNTETNINYRATASEDCFEASSSAIALNQKEEYSYPTPEPEDLKPAPVEMSCSVGSGNIAPKDPLPSPSPVSEDDAARRAAQRLAEWFGGTVVDIEDDPLPLPEEDGFKHSYGWLADYSEEPPVYAQ